MKKIILLGVYVVSASAALGMHQTNTPNDLQQNVIAIAPIVQHNIEHSHMWELSYQQFEERWNDAHKNDSQDGDARYRIDLIGEQKKDITKRISHSQCDSFFY